MLVLHALTGDAHVVGPAGPDQPTPGWWDGLIGPGAPLDTDRYFAIAANVLGGCRGTHRPVVDRPGRTAVTAQGFRGSPSGIRWPPRRRWPTCSGSSRSRRCSAVRWAACGRWNGPSATRTGWAASIAIATCAYFTGDQIAWSVPQLAAIRADGNFRGGDYYDGAPPLAGMAVAREIAHTTYRSALELDTRFGRTTRATRTR